MHQNTIRGPPSSKLALVATALLGVTVGILLAPSTCDSTRDGDNPPNVKFQKRDSCLLELSDGRWELATSGCPRARKGVLSPCDNVHTEYPREWVWSRSGKAASCIPRQLEYSEVARVLGKKRVALVGDSHLRKLYGYMGKFLEDRDIMEAPTYDKKKHTDFSWDVKQTKTRLEFYWRANVITATNLLEEWLESGKAPDVLIMDPSAHQAKWARNFTEFKSEVPGLVDALNRYREKFGNMHPMFWILSPPFKEAFSKDENVTWMYSLKKFNSVLLDSGFMAPGGPVIPIDMFSMAQGCMDWCYRDGTHVVENFNTLLWQILTGAYDFISSKQIQ